MLGFIQQSLLLTHLNQHATNINLSQLKPGPLTLSYDCFKTLLNCSPESYINLLRLRMIIFNKNYDLVHGD